MQEQLASPALLRCRPEQTNTGVRWRVWAPWAKQVELVLTSDSQRIVRPMSRLDGGYFTHEEPAIGEGQRYGFRLDGGPERPDPCSLWQPAGVHQPSAVLFADRFAWTDQKWQGVAREDLVFYELHVGTFTVEGTFDAIVPRLPELRDLGITAIELMPVAQFPGGRNWGYDGVHLFAAQNTYGGPRGLQRLIDAAHAQQLAVFLDVVYNHFGPEGNYISEFGPYYSDRYRTPWGPAFNFDGRDSDAVRDFVLDNVWCWIHDFHLDGLRLDAVHAMHDISPRHILREIKETADAAAAQRGATATIAVESLLNDVKMVLPPERGGFGLDAEWNEDFHHALVAHLTGERHGKYADFGQVQQLPQVLERTFLLSGGYSQYRQRRWGAPVGDLPGDRFIIGIQNHDHVGNRARGERLAALIRPEVLRGTTSLMLLAPHLPLLFMGEEYGELNPFLFFCSFGDPALIESVRQGRQRDYTLEGNIPDPQAETTFAASRLNWSWPPESPQEGLRQLYRDLLAARRAWPALRDWSHRSARLLAGDRADAVLELIRGGREPAAGKTLSIYLNLTERPQAWPLTAADHASKVLFRSESAVYRAATDEAVKPVEPPAPHLGPFECIVLGPPDWQTWSAE